MKGLVSELLQSCFVARTIKPVQSAATPLNGDFPADSTKVLTAWLPTPA
jgi:hypothetical protein